MDLPGSLWSYRTCFIGLSVKVLIHCDNHALKFMDLPGSLWSYRTCFIGLSVKVLIHCDKHILGESRDLQQSY